MIFRQSQMLESGCKIQWLPMPILETYTGWGKAGFQDYQLQAGFGASLNSSNTSLICSVVTTPHKHLFNVLKKSFIHGSELSLPPENHDSKTNDGNDQRSPTKSWSSYVTLQLLGTVSPRHRKLMIINLIPLLLLPNPKTMV